ncbi:unnamed protein product [Triticum turgidum subsp. durum]|uniref:HMA domain-containing protein n=1 Tax=Triticum turgidum subsp. durum TaxID=4567 RepID=A0A9R0WL50_TRITD|nr:unnamed protein product [Triticum turgidum subsp. durum]
MASIQSLDLTYGKALLVNSSSHTKDPRIMHEIRGSNPVCHPTLAFLDQASRDKYKRSRISHTESAEGRAKGKASAPVPKAKGRNKRIWAVAGHLRRSGMSKEEVLKIQTCVLKVNIHCDGCQKKVKKILHKIEGVYQSSIDPEQGKVTVSGMVDPDTIIKKLTKAGKPAELWGSKAGMANQFQKLQLDGGGKGQAKDAGGKGQSKDAGGAKGQKGGGGGGGAGGASKDAMKGMKLPQFMDGKMPFAAAAPMKDPKSVKFNLPPEDEFGDDGSEFDDEFDDFDDEDDFDDDGLDDDYFDDPKMMMKPMAMPPNAGGGDKKGGNNGGKKGGNEIPVQIKGNPNNGGGGGGGGSKKDAGGKQNQGGGGGNGNGGGKNGGGGQANNAKGGGGGAPGGGGQPGQPGKKGGGGGPGLGVVGPMGGIGMPPQQQAMMRPNMMGAAGFPGVLWMHDYNSTHIYYWRE